jgi:8-oxo-dGTP pyrophosphatase MutT (NUDIX family)
MKKLAVCALIFTDNGNILGVSRKDNLTHFGLIGGKVDEGETPEEALIRETFEETGLTVVDYEKIYEREDEKYICFTYLCQTTGEINSSEAGVVKEVTWNELCYGPFGEYNIGLYNHLHAH